MQVIAHLTDLMKYEIRPVSGVTTTTAVPPTPSHKPGIYSPKNPPGPTAYFVRGTTYQEYVERLKSPPGFSYFDRYRYPVEHSEEGKNARAKVLYSSGNQRPSSDDLDLLGKDFMELVKDVNTIENDAFLDDNERAERFAKKYDKLFDFRDYIIGNKKIPPTRAYVTLLSLYDLLNKESKKLQLNKYGGYAQDILTVLAEASTGTSANQLQVILSKIVERRDTKDQSILNKLKTLLTDLEKSNSYLNDALRYIPPLQFSL
ncbi:hypothetical protein ILUMI_20901 [Ignelater luminosus]|uniref:Uncharacterized protein n=1 Tax=Ignelater luminosus TaxID=2038154 RepID=A0A8K0CDH6_IGNLU|nr:hypothetical protein ILUMI_20901 [Ignelater luminosus]